MLPDENNTTKLHTNSEKANAFAEHFKSAHNLTLNSGHDDCSAVKNILNVKVDYIINVI